MSKHWKRKIDFMIKEVNHATRITTKRVCASEIYPTPRAICVVST